MRSGHYEASGQAPTIGMTGWTLQPSRREANNTDFAQTGKSRSGSAADPDLAQQPEVAMPVGAWLGVPWLSVVDLVCISSALHYISFSIFTVRILPDTMRHFAP